MDGKGNDALLKTSRTTEWTLNNGGYSSVLFAGFIIFGCVLAYIVAVLRGTVDPFLPLISDAAGSPPQNGLFGTFISLGGMFGVVFMVLRYMIVLEKNREKSHLVLCLNKLSLVLGIISMCAITLITGYPINFFRHKDVWMSDVGIPHMIGGVTLFSFGIIYVAIQCIITLFIKPRNNTMLMIRVAICIICTTTFVYHLVSVPGNFKAISNAYGNDTNSDSMEVLPPTLGASLRIPIKTDGNYLASAITEWILVFFFCGFFVTFFKETQEYSLMMVVETQFPETVEVSPQDRRMSRSPVGPVSGDRRVSEVRTILRRDSTCQTTDTTEDVVLTPSSKAFENGKYIKRQISSFEMLSGNKLEKLIESTMKAKAQKTAEKDGAKTNGISLDPVTNGIREYIESIDEVDEKIVADHHNHTTAVVQVETVDRGC